MWRNHQQLLPFACRFGFQVSPVNVRMLTGPAPLNRRHDLKLRSVPLTSDEFPRSPGFICAIDAEFVAMTKADVEIRSDGVTFA
jgi:PAB-dependent poly(A)-specific ribonuclease subunit 2